MTDMFASFPQEGGQIGRIIVFIALATSLGGCAGVTFYSDPALTQRTGLKYYISKPYLLVTRNAAKDTPLKADVIQLPDLEHPNYGVYKPGWGTHKFALKVTNGILTEYNQEADSKGPETLGAIGDLISKAGSGIGSLQKQAADVSAAVAAINQASGNLRSASGELPDSSKDAKDKIDATVGGLTTIAMEIGTGNTNQKTRLEAIKASISTIAIDSTFPNAAKLKELLANAQAQIDKAIIALASGSAAEPQASYELYEIRMENGETHLVPARITTSTWKVIQEHARPYGK